MDISIHNLTELTQYKPVNPDAIEKELARYPPPPNTKLYYVAPKWYSENDLISEFPLLKTHFNQERFFAKTVLSDINVTYFLCPVNSTYLADLLSMLTSWWPSNINVQPDVEHEHLFRLNTLDPVYSKYLLAPLLEKEYVLVGFVDDQGKIWKPAEHTCAIANMIGIKLLKAY